MLRPEVTPETTAVDPTGKVFGATVIASIICTSFKTSFPLFVTSSVNVDVNEPSPLSTRESNVFISPSAGVNGGEAGSAVPSLETGSSE